MPTNQEIQDKVDVLQEKLDLEQQQVADLLAQKEAAIAALQAIVDSGETDRQVIFDKIAAVQTDLEATVAP